MCHVLFMDLKDNIKTEVALEMISLYIGLAMKNNKELALNLIKERDSIYLSNTDLVNKVLKEYGKEIKKLIK